MIEKKMRKETGHERVRIQDNEEKEDGEMKVSVTFMYQDCIRYQD